MDKEARIQSLSMKIAATQEMISIVLNGMLNEGQEGITSSKINQFLPSLVQHQHELTIAETELRILKSL